MFYNDPNCAYKILGVYHVHRKHRDVVTQERKHIAFSYRIRGNSTFSFGGQELYAGDGSTVFLPEGVSFRNRNEGNEEILVVHLRAFGSSPKNIRVIPETQNLEPLFRKLLAHWESGSYNRCMGVLYEIFQTLEQAGQTDRAIPGVIAPGVRMLQERFRDPKLTVAQAAKKCFVSEVYFRRVYRQHFGTSPGQDILTMRFDHAMGLLRSGYYTVEQVARQSGFSDAKYFRTAFTKRFGTSPSRWQNQFPK